MGTIRGVTHERRAGHEQRDADEHGDSSETSRRAASLPVADGPDELAPELPERYFPLPPEADG